MSPREALKRITPSLASFQKGSASRLSAESAAQARLEAIAEEIQALPIGDSSEIDILSFPERGARRDIAAPLRWFLFSDALALTVGFTASWLVASLANLFFFDRTVLLLIGEGVAFRFLSYAAIAIGVLLWFGNKGHYRVRQPFWMEAQQIVRAFGFALMIDGFLQFAVKQDFSRLWLVSGWVFAAAAVLVFRAAARWSLRRAGQWQVRTLLVGSGRIADETRAALRTAPELGYDIVMQVENALLLLERAGRSWRNLCNRFDADYVVIALDGHVLAEAGEALEMLSREGIPYSVSPPLRHLPVLETTPQYFFSHEAMLMIPASHLDLPLARAMKRALDILGAGLGLLFLSPLFVLIALWVKKDGGNVFFSDVRIGMNGKPFRCLKFRSMVVNADAILWRYLDEHPEKKAEWAKYHKLRDGDPRITRIGAILRRCSLDELPQLINVLKGDMSLVGPRPIMFRERGSYSEDLVHYCRVRPGLTGLWQVSGRSNLSFSRRVQMDIWYVRNWSLWHDIAILFKTIPAILNKTGAY